MPRFCANLTMLYNEHGFLDRFAAAHADGFRGVGFMFPYDYPKEAISDAPHRNELVQVLHNLPAGDWAGAERGIACLPDRIGEFQDGVGRIIDYATALGCARLHRMLNGEVDTSTEELRQSEDRNACPACGDPRPPIGWSLPAIDKGPSAFAA